MNNAEVEAAVKEKYIQLQKSMIDVINKYPLPVEYRQSLFDDMLNTFMDWFLDKGSNDGKQS